MCESRYESLRIGVTVSVSVPKCKCVCVRKKVVSEGEGVGKRKRFWRDRVYRGGRHEVFVRKVQRESLMYNTWH